MAHNPQWLVNKHPKNLKAQIKELVQHGYTVTLQDSSSAQLIRKKSFSCLFAIVTGIIPYALYYMAKNDYTVYLDLDTQIPDPNGTKKEPSQMILLLKVCGIIFIVLISISAIVGFIQGLSEEGSSTATSEDIKAIVDGPHILDLTIEQARAELGTPTDGDLTEPNAQQVALGTTTWNNSFEVQGYSVLLDYDVKTREVTELFIATNEDDLGDGGTGETRDWKPLLSIASLSQDADSYTIIPVEALAHPDYYTGLRALDK